MDIEKLIHCLQCCARVDAHNVGCDDCGLEYCGPECQQLCWTAATALSTLKAENAEMQQQLNEFSEFLCHMTGGLLSKTNYTAQEMIAAADDYQQKACGECDLRVENEKLLAENNMLRKMQPVELNGEAARSLSLALEVSQLREELEQVKRERDAIEQDFRAFTKQWWEQDSGFPCRWCKFENSGGCEWKAKQPNEEKICAGRAFEWRGQKEE